MGRRNDHSPVEFDKMVVDTVWQWLQNQSASDLSLRKIASLIGYAPSTLVSVYGSYALLLLRVNSATLDRLAQNLAVTDPKAPARDRLLDAALGYLNFAREHPHAFRLIFEHKLAEGQSLPPHFCDKLEAMFGLVEAPLANCAQSLAPAPCIFMHACCGPAYTASVSWISTTNYSCKAPRAKPLSAPCSAMFWTRSPNESPA